MASGHKLHRSHPIDAEEERQLEALLADPIFQKAIQAYDKEDDAHQVAYLAGSDNDGRTVDFDRDFVAAIEAGKVLFRGQPFDPRPFIAIHEKVEGAILRQQFEPKTWILPQPHYEIAHRIATIAEKHAVEHVLGAGAWNDYDRPLEPYIKEDEHEQIKDPPPNILKQPYVTDARLLAKMSAAPLSVGQSGDRLSESQPAGSPRSVTPFKADAPDSNSRQAGARMPDNTGEKGKAYGSTKTGRVGGNPGYPKDGGQYGARMPNHMHALTIASATHLHKAGHIDKKQLATIHATARNAMAAAKPPKQPNAQMPPSMPSFGALGGSMGGGGQF